MRAQTTPGQLVTLARALLDRPSREASGVWPRAVALIGRQALELALSRSSARNLPGLEKCSVRAQLSCLARVPALRDWAADSAQLWQVLSQVCHHHPYELAPEAPELDLLLGRVSAAVGPEASGSSSPADQQQSP